MHLNERLKGIVAIEKERKKKRNREKQHLTRVFYHAIDFPMTKYAVVWCRG